MEESPSPCRLKSGGKGRNVYTMVPKTQLLHTVASPTGNENGFSVGLANQAPFSISNTTRAKPCASSGLDRY